MRKRTRFHNLKNPKIRSTWNKINLYNLSRMTGSHLGDRTFFQQKWSAKSATRAYHGEHIREKTWERMFRKQIPSVVSMSHLDLAQDDGTENSAGRGAGKDNMPRDHTTRTPYMSMTYYPIERRLDSAIWRALFASSARQARQFVVHGAVKVNGKIMRHPSYLLNPGDMFSVDPERVLWAIGAPKEDSAAGQATIEGSEESAQEEIEEEEVEQSEPAEATAEGAGDASEAGAPKPKNQLKALQKEVEALEADPPENFSNKRKQEARALLTTIKRTRGKGDKLTQEEVDALTTTLMTLRAKIANPNSRNPTAVSTSEGSGLTPDEEKRLNAALERLRAKQAEHDENPLDPTKPYLTPWRPRPFMAPFAFIPRYLEVNQNVCAAVYLRHPVARPGLAEVPTPFQSDTSQLAFNWYLRRR
ncbi:alpha-L RNA-binding motif-containing protein [Aulographum hederae CBS 113979]|uniref:Small ribosomal subunit protein uS4m n=1 Tax=Aulographum hederae CBS 113979 TaxID=1176131 RepID=A0A6G1HHI9_9PEZI|nr:alpha-L RNA-binding motif-containing protein [Aulographum hederae CBS 113979]